MELRYITAGESHGPALIAVIEGLPAGLDISQDLINQDLSRRQQGYGRGGRMNIEADKVEILSGVRFGKTIGSPLTVQVVNRDWKNWTERMSVAPLENYEKIVKVTQPRPGHVDYAGAMKYGFDDMRNVLERASARETTMRVLVGSIAKQLLKQFDVDIIGYIISIGDVSSPAIPESVTIPQIREITEVSPFRCYYPQREPDMKSAVDAAKRAGDTLGGIFEVIADHLPVGLGSYVQWDRKLDGKIAQAVMSIQAIKGVEIGMGFHGAKSPGSMVHDPIYQENHVIKRRSNHAGGLEGGVTNGQRLVVRAAMKPIATLMKALESVDMNTMESTKATVERSDVCAAPAAAVIAEAVVAIELAKAFQDKFGSDSLDEMKRNYLSYLDNLPMRK